MDVLLNPKLPKRSLIFAGFNPGPGLIKANPTEKGQNWGRGRGRIEPEK